MTQCLGPLDAGTRTERLLVYALHLIAAGLSVATVLAFATNGLRIDLGLMQFTATNPERVALQTAIVWLIATLASSRRGSRWVIVPILVVILAAWVDSAPRRVGDGTEYMTMALNMSRGLPPALSRDDWLTAGDELRHTAGFEASDPVPPLEGRNGRRDFRHFWLYSLLAAPLIAATRVVGVHPNHAFTILNILLLMPLLWLLVRRGHTVAAGLIVSGPLMWWIDKAHTEIFLFVTLASAALLVDEHPALALVAAALATAQNPAAGVMLAGAAIYVMSRDRSTRAAFGIAVAAVVALVPLIYSEWRLGTWSPLAGTLTWSVPGLHAVTAPLLDPNLGLVPYAPVLIALAAVGSRARRAMTLLVVAVSVGLLLVCALSDNVNHGGTPGMSRYALWLLAIMTPLLVLGSERLGRRHTWAVAAMCLSAVMSWAAFRPSWAERANSPNYLASSIWSHWPGLDNPLPEVFAERVTGIDGIPPVPAALTSCRKILIRGDGRSAWWPFPCPPGAAPQPCLAVNALCYVNNGEFFVAPAQPQFDFDPVSSRAWSIRDKITLGGLLQRLGAGARSINLAASPQRVIGGDDLLPLFIVEGETGTAIWARGRLSSSAPSIHLRAARPSQIEVWQLPSFTLLSRWRADASVQNVPVSSDQETLFVVTDLD